MKNFKNCFSVVLFIAFSSSLFAQKDNTGTYIDQEVIPYGFLQFNMGLAYSNYTRYEYESYTVDGPSPYAANTIAPIPYQTLNKISNHGGGAGLELHLPLIYLLAHNKERRFRVADDLGLGTYLITNETTRKDVLTNKDIIVSQGYSSNPKIDGSIIFYYGFNAVFRINKTFDVGVKYYPLFFHYDFMNAAVFAQTFGFTARVNRLYLDFRTSHIKNKSWTVNKGFSTLTARYSIRPFGSDKTPNFIVLTYSTLVFQTEIFAAGQTPPEYVGYKIKNNNWTLIQLGWGMGF